MPQHALCALRCAGALWRSVRHGDEAPVTCQKSCVHALARRLAPHGAAVTLQLGLQRGLALGLGGALVVQHPPTGALRRLLAVHQPVDTQALPLEVQRGFVDRKVHDAAVPGPRAFAGQDALRGLRRHAGRCRGDVEVPREMGHAGRRPAVGAQVGQRRPSHPGLFQQLVHGFAQARGWGGKQCCRGVRGFLLVYRLPLATIGPHGRRGAQRNREHRQLGQRDKVGCALGRARPAQPSKFNRCIGCIRPIGRTRRIHIRQQGRQPVPPAARCRYAGLHGRQRQAVLGARHRHIKHVELFALAGLLLDGQRSFGAGRRARFAGQEDKARGLGLLAGPVHQHAHGLGLLRAGGAGAGVEAVGDVVEDGHVAEEGVALEHEPRAALLHC